MPYDNDIERQRRIADLLRRSKAAREMWPQAQEADLQSDLMGRMGYAGEKIARAFTPQTANREDWQYKPYAQALLGGAQKGYKEDIGAIEEEALSDPDSEASDLMRQAVGDLGAPELKQGRMSARQLESMMKPLKAKADVAASERLGEYRKGMVEAAKDKAAKAKVDALKASDPTTASARALQSLYKQELRSRGYEADEESINNLPEGVVNSMLKDLTTFGQKEKLGEQKYKSAKEIEKMRGETTRDVLGTRMRGEAELADKKGQISKELQILRDQGALGREEFKSMMASLMQDKKGDQQIALEKERQGGRLGLESAKAGSAYELQDLKGDQNLQLQDLKGDQGEEIQGAKSDSAMELLKEKGTQAKALEGMRTDRMKYLEGMKQAGIINKAQFDAAVKLIDREMQGDQGLKLQDAKTKGGMDLLDKKQAGDVVIQGMKDKTALEIAKMRLNKLGITKPAGMSAYQFENQAQKLSKALEGHVEAQQKYEHLNKVLSKYGATLENFDPKKVNLPGISLPFVGRVGAGEQFGELKSAVGAILSQELYDRSGKAVTEQELERMKEDFNMGKFNTEEQLIKAARRYKVIENKLKNNVVAGFHPDVVSTFKSRGGEVPEYDKIKAGKKAKDLTQKERAEYILAANKLIRSGDPEKVRKGQEVIAKLKSVKKK